jgi:AraC-like DNA-binding protein
MRLDEIILVILSGLGVFHGCFFAFILFTKKSLDRLSNQLLGILLLILSLRIGKSVALAFSKNLEIIFIYLGLCLLLLIGPLFYLYSRTLIQREKALHKIDFLHFFPALLFVLLSVPLQIVGFRKVPEVLTYLLFLIFYGHFFIYLVFVKRKISNQTAVPHFNKDLNRWLLTLFYGLVSIWVVYVLNLFEDRMPYVVGPIVYSFVVYAITYRAVSGKVFQSIQTEKYSTSNVSDQEVEVLFKMIESAVQDAKLFLEPDISLALLSKKLKASPQKISLAINSRAGRNFNEYINSFRIAYALELLNAPKGRALTIAAVGTESGFNSISSFNKAFKKVTGTTPSSYRKVNH